MRGVPSELSAAEAAAMLGWWLESGVDIAVQEEPRNWLKNEAPPPQAAASAASVAAAEPDAMQIPDTLEMFRQWLGTAPSLPLAQSGVRRVLPVGAEGAPIMLLADSPSADEASAERPIGGEAWELTERILAAIGIAADDAYCANISCFHAPGSRMNPDEQQACAAIARRHVALARPKRLLLLGEGPAQALLGKSVASARSHVHSVEGIRTVATFHPRFLIKHSSSKSLAWKDILLLMEDM